MNEKKEEKVIVIYTDGAAGPTNPGNVGVGVYIPCFKYGNFRYFEDKGTNNEAEYLAVLEALNFLKYKLNDKNSVKLVFRVDSKLIQNQLNDSWQVKVPELKKLNEEVREDLKLLIEQGKISSWKFNHVYRDFNLVADALSKTALQRKEHFDKKRLKEMEGKNEQKGICYG